MTASVTAKSVQSLLDGWRLGQSILLQSVIYFTKPWKIGSAPAGRNVAEGHHRHGGLRNQAIVTEAPTTCTTSTSSTAWHVSRQINRVARRGARNDV